MLMSRSKYRSSVDLCADCGASDPSWASVNRGLLLCAECCSVHRSMGRHISHVKSLRQGSWPPSLLAMINAMTAQNVNSIWEHSLLDTSAPKHLRKKPQPKDPLHPTKSEFIFAKHLKLEYVLHARRDEPPSELGRQLHSAVRSASLDTALRLLAQGADPNYYNEEKGSTCLHVACRAGQPSQAELLVCWGADPNARDRNGCTPSDCARQGGHIELAQRMVELVYEATDKLIVFLTGERPQHGAGSHYLAPRPRDAHEMTDVAKAARGKLQLLPNHLFEELVMDIYDEIDRRETEEIWQTSASGLERCGVVFLPVNPALSAPRNQGRQKLARLSSTELLALLRDVLVDATRRQHIATLQPRGPYNPMLSGAHLRQISHMSDDEPLYDSVASDDDYAALVPAVDFEMLNATPKTGETVSSLYNPSLPNDIVNEKPKQLSQLPSTSNFQLETLKKELDNRDSTISELKSQLKNLQTIVEQLTKENSVLKTSGDDTQSMVSQNSTITPNENSTNGLGEKAQERGKSMETEQMTRITDEGAEFRPKSNQRPVSMYETREGPKNNWQVTKHQLTTLTGLDRSLTQSVLEGGAVTLPSADIVHRRAESVTRGIQDLWASAREQQPMLLERGETIRHAVRGLLAIFPNNCPDRDVNLALNDLRSACEAVTYSCTVSSPLDEVRSAAYDLAKATKHLLTHFNVDS